VDINRGATCNCTVNDIKFPLKDEIEMSHCGCYVPPHCASGLLIPSNTRFIVWRKMSDNYDK
jgi:hypothetical protein